MPVTLHLAKWLVPVTLPVMENAGIAVSEGRITALDTKKNLLKHFSGGAEIVDHGDSIIMPALVNAHCHLELSIARGKTRGGKGFYAWLKSIMNFRQENTQTDQSAFYSAALDAAGELHQNGTAVIADTGNTDTGLKVLSGLRDKKIPCFLAFREIIHPLPGEADLPDLSDFSPGICHQAAISPHSVYTCSRKVLLEIKNWCRAHSLPFSIHCAESPEETEFVRTGGGPLAEILSERGRDISSFFRMCRSPVMLLDETGILDSSTICVHCVSVTEEDLEILAGSGCSVCLCPGSNEFIGTGTAPIERIFSSMSDRVCLGTDSLASNTQLSILGEMRMIMKKAGGVSPELVLRAATINGAEALGFSAFTGSIEPGKRAFFLVLEESGCKREEIHEFICCTKGPFPLKLVSSQGSETASQAR